MLPGTIVLALALVAFAIAPLGTSAAKTGYVLVQQGGKLTGAGENAGGRLGSSAALSADGKTLIVGAPKDGRGAVYVFTPGSGSTWTQAARLTPGEVAGEGECTGGGAGCSSECTEELAEGGEDANECAFGSSVALSADGDTALVGDPSATSAPGAVWVLTREGATWTHTATLVAGGSEGEDGRFGRSVALSGDGATALIGDPSSHALRGSAWVFTREGTTWSPVKELEDEEASAVAHMGRSVALSADGATALAGGPGDDNFTGAAWTFKLSEGVWQQQPGKLRGEGVALGNHFGKSVALSGDGSTALVGAQDAEGERGAVWAFVSSGGAFAEQGPKIPGNAGTGPDWEGRFGTSMALSADGDTALVGAPRAKQGIGIVTVLTRSGSTWTRLPEGLGGSEAKGRGWLGTAVALSGDASVAAVGAPRDHTSEGAAWVFVEAPSSTIGPPVVTNVAPGHGSTAGGTEVRILGEDFNEAEEVRFGATAVKVTAANATEISMVTPPAPAGKVDVTVTTPRGTSATSSRDTFVYEAPGGEGEGGREEPGTSKEGETTHESPNGKTSRDGSKTASGGSGGVLGFVASAGDCRVSLARKRLAVTRYRSVALRLVRTGAAAACSGRVALSYRIKAQGRGYTLRTIGTAAFSIPSGTASRVITVKLSRAGRRWFRAHKGKGNASVAIARIVPAPTLAQSSSVRLSVKRTRRH